MKIIILAGGKGSRLWPLSQKSCPKPFLRFGGRHSLLQKVILRFLGTYNPEDILVVAAAESAFFAKQQCDELTCGEKITVLCESIGRNTAPALALAFCFLRDKVKEDEPVLIVPSDGLISPLDNFLEAIASSEEKAKEGKIILFGVKPTKAETSYGYIKTGKKEGDFFTENTFLEKPVKEIAEKLFSEEGVFWNTGHLLLSAKTFWEQVRLHSPDIMRLEGLGAEECNRKLCEIESVSVDYALLEKSTEVLAKEMIVTWSDLGTWSRVYEAFEKDPNGNVMIGEVIDTNSKQCFVLSNTKKIVTIGLEDLIVVETEEALFLAKKNEAYKIGELLCDEGVTSVCRP